MDWSTVSMSGMVAAGSKRPAGRCSRRRPRPAGVAGDGRFLPYSRQATLRARPPAQTSARGHAYLDPCAGNLEIELADYVGRWRAVAGREDDNFEPPSSRVGRWNRKRPAG